MHRVKEPTTLVYIKPSVTEAETDKSDSRGCWLDDRLMSCNDGKNTLLVTTGVADMSCDIMMNDQEHNSKAAQYFSGSTIEL